jgi:ribosomal protein L44E
MPTCKLSVDSIAEQVAGLEAGKADAEEEPRGRPAEEVQPGDRTAPTRSHRSTKRVSIKVRCSCCTHDAGLGT